MKRIAILASGEGTNTQHLIDYFRGTEVHVAHVICNNPKANVLKRAEKNGIPFCLINKEWLVDGKPLMDILGKEKIDWIVCAGFLWKIPDKILHAFPDRVVNIHPALLPKFGGKGMYGMHVHKAVIDAKEKESGITIHYLNEHYDEGKIIFQARCDVSPTDTPESLAQKVQELEHAHFAKTVEQLINK